MPVDPLHALKDIRGYARANRIELTGHAEKRMAQRRVSYDDIQHCLENAPACVWQAKDQTWLVEGEDLDGDELSVGVVIEDGVVIVTVF